MTRSNRQSTSLSGWLLTVLAFALLLPTVVSAQQPPPVVSDKNSAGPGSSSDVDQDRESSSLARRAEATPAPAPERYPIKGLGSARLLNRHADTIGIGPLYVSSFEHFYIENRAAFPDPVTGQEIKSRLTASIFRTDMVMDRRLRRGRLAIQFQPTMGAVNGKFKSNSSNQLFSFDYATDLSPRFSLTFSESFLYYGNRSLFGDLYFDADPSSGTIFERPTPFGARSLIFNITRLALNYKLSPRTRLSVRPQYGYHYAFANTAISLSSNNQRIYGLRTELVHQLAPERVIGVFQTMDWRQFSGIIPDTNYVTTGVLFSDHIRRGWFFGLSVGAAGSAPRGSARNWTPTVEVSTVKSLSRSGSFAFSYTRNNTFTDFSTNGYYNRYEASYSQRLGSRALTTLGSGYFGRSGATDRFTGYYTIGRISYRLFSHFSLFAVYSYRNLDSNRPQVPTERRNYLAMGFQWSPRGLNELY